MTLDGVSAVYFRGHAHEQERQRAVRTSERPVTAHLFRRTSHRRGEREGPKAPRFARARTACRRAEPPSRLLLAANKISGVAVAARRTGKTAAPIHRPATRREVAGAAAGGNPGVLRRGVWTGPGRSGGDPRDYRRARHRATHLRDLSCVLLGICAGFRLSRR